MSTWLGIDIGTTAVKVAAVRTGYRKAELVGLASVEVAQAGDVTAAISAAVKAAVGERGGVGDGIAIGLEGQRATVKTLGLPASAAKQIGEVLPFELESALPFDVEEAVFDYRLLSGTREKKGEELAVLVGVAKTVDVVARIDLVKGAVAHEPERVGVGAFPIANLLQYVPALGEGTVAVVDLGTVSSDVLVMKGGEPVFGRTVGLGTKGLPGTAAKLARELRTTIAAHRAAGGEAPGRLFLCGGGAYVSGAEAFLSSALEIPVEVLPAPAFEAVGIAPESMQALARFSKALGLAAGLALGTKALGLNLRKGPLAFERGFTWVKEKVPLLAGLAAVILVSFLFSAWAQLYAKSKERAVLEKSLALVTKEVLGEETSAASRANELLSAQTSLADEDPLPHADAFDVMVKLSELIPQSMTHDIEELDVQKGHVIVHGVVSTIPDAQAIRASVANERCFSDAKITRTNAQVGGSNQKYVLEFDIKCPEDQKGGAKAKSAASAAASSSAAPGGSK
ncbi:MAG: pilus assembly protein PilM [Deltaproteobacteria bacterium]|nr:pilus assembly protein PilM [Deltaproteobacteria bacterium]